MLSTFFLSTQQVKPKLLILSERPQWFGASCSELVFSKEEEEEEEEEEKSTLSSKHMVFGFLHSGKGMVNCALQSLSAAALQGSSRATSLDEALHPTPRTPSLLERRRDRLSFSGQQPSSLAWRDSKARRISTV
ncbi:hypothetical protein C4D60_Mb05t05670 [Musa balbisiana]|uniref:Uncharacterized protein n=1 Tax=Musa balbisiana TaxID=52838 RepID=A0A4S8JTX7_MUSBA|nr:hypothetical protein C4D60_Mb05t05670 [Musa balbisiana]